MTARRVQNLIQARHDERRGALMPSSYPVKLTVEATNVCNLRCPACFTGAGEMGRKRSMIEMELYRKLLDELGPYLFELELYNWGEPLLNKNVFTMIEEASQAGISTTVSTNFSIPFDDARAERLVASGLSLLGVSIDGATQESYEQYRVGGDLEKVLDNCKRVLEAKRRLGSVSPHMVWEYHVFPHNQHEVELGKKLAEELGMTIAVDKGWVVGPEWEPESEFQFFIRPKPSRCSFLWYQAVVNNDGGVAPCCGTFYREHDLGRVGFGDQPGSKTFRGVWRGPRFQAARSLFRKREITEKTEGIVCYDCPATKTWERFKEHLGGGTTGPFDVGGSANDGFNFFWGTRPPGTPQERGLVPLRRKTVES